MNDWTSSLGSGWSIWIIVLVLINVLGCVWLLWINSKRRPGDPATRQPVLRRPGAENAHLAANGPRPM